MRGRADRQQRILSAAVMSGKGEGAATTTRCLEDVAVEAVVAQIVERHLAHRASVRDRWRALPADRPAPCGDGRHLAARASSIGSQQSSSQFLRRPAFGASTTATSSRQAARKRGVIAADTVRAA